ncbi:MAG: hypothetical protein WDZ59_11270 [Pirellulales bacterium]
MKRQYRGVAIGAVVVLMAALSAAAGVYSLMFRLPSPAEADVEGLFRWLVTRDLADESSEIRRQLIARLEPELDRGIELSSVEDRLDREQLAQFEKNIDRLLADWYVTQCQTYFATPTDQRRQHLDALLDRVSAWNVSELLAQFEAVSDTRAAPKQNPLLQLSQRMNSWNAEAAPEQQAALKKFQADLQARALWRSVSGTVGRWMSLK